MCRVKCNRGFTLVEIIVVIVLLGILSIATTIGINAYSQRSVFNQAYQLQKDISHIQALALANNLALRLTFSQSTSQSGFTSYRYTVICRTTTASSPCTSQNAIPINPVTGQLFDVLLTDSVILQATIGASTTIATLPVSVDFDSVGRPASASGLIATEPVNTFRLSTANTLPAKGNTAPAIVTLHPLTGFSSVTNCGVLTNGVKPTNCP